MVGLCAYHAAGKKLRGKVSSEEKAFIKGKRALNWSLSQIAKALGRPNSTVWSVLNPEHVDRRWGKPGFHGRANQCPKCRTELEHEINRAGYRVEICPICVNV